MTVRKTCRPGTPCTVLMIEDDAVQAALLIESAKQYEPDCFVIEAAGSLTDAAPRLAEIQYDAVLLDLGLPDSDGIATLHITQKLVAGKIPIVIMTGSDDTSIEISAFECDAAEYITKPINVPRLLTRIRHAILRHRRLIAREETQQARYQELEREIAILKTVESAITGEPQARLHQAAEAILKVATSLASGV